MLVEQPYGVEKILREREEEGSSQNYPFSLGVAPPPLYIGERGGAALD